MGCNGTIKKATVLILTVVICLLAVVPVKAVSYQYDNSDSALAAPDGYTVKYRVRSSDIGAKTSWAPTDIFIDNGGFVHLLDQQNGCVFVFSEDLKYLHTVTFKENGGETFLANLNGLCVDREGDKVTYYIADTDNKRVFFADGEGNIFREIVKPDTAAFNSQNAFSPLKVGLDSNKNLYVLASGIYQGVCVFSAQDDYEFLTFLGGNTVESTASIIADYFWKQIFNSTQIASMKRYVPVSPANFFIGENDSLYTVTNKSSKGTNFENEIKKFNANSVNIIVEQDWGDLELARDDNNLPVDTSYVDIALGDNGLIAAIDGNLCRIAVFTAQGDRLFTFGENSHTVDGFDTPVAIEMRGNTIYAVDSYRQSITAFAPNEYGKLVLEAAALHGEGKYEEAFPLWKQVIKQNGACLLAFTGLGKQYLASGDYEKAMESFRQGGDREGYSEAFALNRSTKVQKIFPILAIALVAGFVMLLVADRRLKNKAKREINPADKKFIGKILYTLFHPCEGSMELARKTAPRKTLIAAAVIILIWFLADVLQWCTSGFIFNENNLADFNVWLRLAGTAGLFALWIASVWLVSNLMDSSARFTDLVVTSAVAMIPYIAGVAVCTLLTNILTLEESTYITIIRIVCIIWSFAILWGAMREIHEMNFRTSLLCMIFTLLGMVLIIFMAILLWSLFQQVISFATQIIIEFKKMIG